VRSRINRLLETEKTMHLVSFSVIDHDGLTRRLRAGGKDRVVMDGVLRSALKDFGRRYRKNYEVFPADAGGARYNIFLPGSSHKESLAFCGFLKEAIQKYLIKHKVEDAFVNVAVTDLPSRVSWSGSEKAPVGLRIERMRLGLEKRYFTRYPCRLDFYVMPGGLRAYAAGILDISEGGICFGIDRRLEADTNLRIRLNLLEQGISLPVIAGRIVWIKESGGPGAKYKAGLEFIRLSRQNLQVIAKFIGQVLSKQSGTRA